MNLQQLLDLENPNTKERAMQTLAANRSKTALEATRRVLSDLQKVLFTTKLKGMTLAEVTEAVTETIEILQGGIQPEEKPAVQMPKKTA